MKKTSLETAMLTLPRVPRHLPSHLQPLLRTERPSAQTDVPASCAVADHAPRSHCHRGAPLAAQETRNLKAERQPTADVF